DVGIEEKPSREQPSCDDGGGRANRRSRRQRRENDRHVEEVAEPQPGSLIENERKEDCHAARDSRAQQGMTKPVPHCPTKIASRSRRIVTRSRVSAARRTASARVRPPQARSPSHRSAV